MFSTLHTVSAIFGFYRLHKNRFSSLTGEPYFNVEVFRPYVGEFLQNPDPFDLAKLVTIEDMFRARVHYGHKVCNILIISNGFA